MRFMLRLLARLVGAIVLFFAGPLAVLTLGDLDFDADWRTADRSAAHIAPKAEDTPEALVQIWGARAFRWRGAFGLHTWIALKPTNATRYEIYQVIGWYARGGRSSVVSDYGPPDRRWYGAEPKLYGEIRGAAAASAIPRIREAIATYPSARRYVVWPGPNSNTFVSHIARAIPELVVDLPPHALGKDFLLDGAWIAPAPSNTGFQVSARGLFAVTLAREEGLEVSVLGLTFGLDPNDLAIKLPGLGKLSLR